MAQFVRKDRSERRAEGHTSLLSAVVAAKLLAVPPTPLLSPYNGIAAIANRL